MEVLLRDPVLLGRGLDTDPEEPVPLLPAGGEGGVVGGVGPGGGGVHGLLPAGPSYHLNGRGGGVEVVEKYLEQNKL